MVFKDFAQNELATGDIIAFVVATRSSQLNLGRIVKFSPSGKTVSVEPLSYKVQGQNKNVSRDKNQIVLVSSECRDLPDEWVKSLYGMSN